MSDAAPADSEWLHLEVSLGGVTERFHRNPNNMAHKLGKALTEAEWMGPKNSHVVEIPALK